VQLYTHTYTNFVANITLLNAVHLVLLHVMNRFSRAAGDVISTVIFKRCLTMILINYKTLLFVHISLQR